jgi:hypothetical protein
MIHVQLETYPYTEILDPIYLSICLTYVSSKAISVPNYHVSSVCALHFTSPDLTWLNFYKQNKQTRLPLRMLHIIREVFFRDAAECCTFTYLPIYLINLAFAFSPKEYYVVLSYSLPILLTHESLLSYRVRILPNPAGLWEATSSLFKCVCD